MEIGSPCPVTMVIKKYMALAMLVWLRVTI